MTYPMLKFLFWLTKLAKELKIREKTTIFKNKCGSRKKTNVEDIWDIRVACSVRIIHEQTKIKSAYHLIIWLLFVKSTITEVTATKSRLVSEINSELKENHIIFCITYLIVSYYWTLKSLAILIQCQRIIGRAVLKNKLTLPRRAITHVSVKQLLLQWTVLRLNFSLWKKLIFSIHSRFNLVIKNVKL